MSHDGYDSNFALNDPRENLAVHTESRVICDMVGRKGVGGEGQNNSVNAGERGAMTRAVMDRRSYRCRPRRRSHPMQDSAGAQGAAEGVWTAGIGGDRAANGENMQPREAEQQQQLDSLILTTAREPLTAERQGRIEAWQHLRKSWFGAYLPLSITTHRFTSRHRLETSDDSAPCSASTK